MRIGAGRALISRQNADCWGAWTGFLRRACALKTRVPEDRREFVPSGCRPQRRPRPGFPPVGGRPSGAPGGSPRGRAEGQKGNTSVTTMDSAEPTRRDFLYIATGAVGAIGAATTLVPLIGQMNPDASTIAAGAPI